MHDNRVEQNFDLAADQRQRRMFTALVVAGAVLAMIGGVLLAIYIISPPDEDDVPPMPTKPERPKAVVGFDPIDNDDDDEEPPPIKTKKPPGNDVARGIRKIQPALDACAAKHGAIDGTKVHVDFTVQGNGSVSASFSRSPHSKTPLGLCVANVIRNRGKFGKLGVRDISRLIVLHRD